MTRIWVVLVVVALSMVTAMSAGAAPPKCDLDPTLPGCSATGGGGDDPEAGTTCALAGGFDRVAAENGDFTVLSLGAGNACIDVSDVDPGNWHITASNTKGLRTLVLQVWDSWAPGDLCAEWRYRKNAPFEQPIVLFDIPADVINACGEEYADTDSALAFTVITRGKDLGVDLGVDVGVQPGP